MAICISMSACQFPPKPAGLGWDYIESIYHFWKNYYPNNIVVYKHEHSDPNAKM